MADVNSNIVINVDSSAALAQLKRLQAGLSKFHQTLAEGNLAAANAQKGLNASLLQSIGTTGKFAASQVKVATSTQAFTRALETNKLSLKEYFRYSAAAATANTKTLSRMFAEEREILNRARRDRVKALQAQYVQLSRANGGFVEALRVMPKTLMMANGQFTELGTRIQYAAQRQQFLNQLLKQGSTQLLNFGKNTQWAGRQLMVGLTIPLSMLGGYAAKSFREVEEVLVKFKRVYGDAFTNEAEVNAAVDNIQRLASEYTKYGLAIKDTIDMAATAAAAGFTGGALEAQVRESTRLAVLGQVEQQQALETTISLQNAFGLAAEDLASKINFLNAVENQTVLSIEDLTIAIPKAAPIVKQLGGDVEDLAFFLTAMKEGGINASEGANALKSGLASLINPTDKASEMLGELGINIKGIVEANKGDLKGTVVGFARALDTLDPLNRARAIEQLFGKFQFSRLSTLFQNVTKDGTQASRAFQLAGASVEELAILSEREMRKIEDSVGVKFQAALEDFKKTIMPLGKEFLEAVTPVVKFFGNLFERFNDLSDGTKKTVTVITAVVAGLGPIFLMTFGLLANGLANLIKLFATIRGGMAKLNGQNKMLGAGFDYVTQQELENLASSNALHSSHSKLISVFNVESEALRKLAASYGMAASQARSLAAANPSLFMSPGAGAAVSKLPGGRAKGYKDGIISVPGPKGAGDVVPAMLSPEETVISAEKSKKYRGLITAIFNDKVPGYAGGKLPWISGHPVKQSGAVDVGMPKGFAQVTQSRQIADQIDKAVSGSRFASMKPTNFGTLLQPFSGRSFPIRGVGGVYRKPDGSLVVVKPTMDEKTALAEVRATQIARDVHGLVSPKQEIRTMIDPTDPTGKRKIIVLESPYDPRIAGMNGKFTKKDMVSQLVASTLRADKDLQQANLSGNVLSDVGTAGVFSRASGFRDYEKNLPGMGDMATINLLGVKGGAKKFFAQETSGIASKMSAKEYEKMIIKEIDQSLPKLRKVIDNWNLNPVEKQIYENMYARLEAGKKVDWQKMHAMHVAAGQQVKKLEEGFNANKASDSTVEKVLAKGIWDPSQLTGLKSSPESKRQLDDLTRKLQIDLNEARASLTRNMAILDGSDPQRIAFQERMAKLDKGIQSKYLDHIKNNMVFFDGKYYHAEDIKSGGSLSNGRTYEDVKREFLYRSGVLAKEQNGISSFTSVKKMTASDLKGNLRYTGKEGGGWRSNIPSGSPLYKALDAYDKQLKAVNARVASGGIDNASHPSIRNLQDSSQRIQTALRNAGFSEREIAKQSSFELSHIAKTGEKGRGPAKWAKGSAGFDVRLLNNYMNTAGRTNKLINWNAQSGYSLFSAQEEKSFKAAADFMAKGQHPTNPRHVGLVIKALELEQRAAALLKSNDPTLTKGLKSALNLSDTTLTKNKILLEELNARTNGRFYNKNNLLPVFNLASGRTQGQTVGVRAGEWILNKSGLLQKLTKSNTQPLPSNVQPRSTKTGKPTADNRVTTINPQSQRVVRMGKVGIPGYQDAPGVPTRLKTFEELGQKAQRRIERSTQNIERQLRISGQYNERQIERLSRNFREGQIEDALKKRNVQIDRQIASIKEKQLAQTIAQQKADAKTARQTARMARQEKVGKYSGGVSAVLGTAGMGAMMTGNTGMGMGLMGASAVAGMAPMLTNPYIAAGTAVAALAASFIIADKKAKEHAEATSKLIDATTASTQKMSRIGEITNKVGASEIMSRRRNQGSANKYLTGFERGKEPFGSTFLSSEVGQEVFAGFKESIVKFGAETSAKQMALQLSGYVSDGILSAEQAQSVAQAIGLNLKNSKIGADISGELLSLIGPGGEDLLKNPLEVRVNLVNQQRDLAKSLGFNNVVDTAASQMGPKILLNPKKMIDDVNKAKTFAAGVAAYGAQNLEFNQAQIDSMTIQYEKQIATLQAQKAATADKAKQAQIQEKIDRLTSEQETNTGKLRKVNAQLLKDQVEAYKVASKRGDVEDAFFDSLKSQVKTKWEGDPMAEAFLKQSADLDSKELEVKINTVVASGQISPMAASSLMNMFAGKEKELNKTLNTAMKFQDPGKFMEVINFFGGMKDKKVGKKNVKMLVNISKENPEQADKLMSTVMLMQKMDGKEVNLEAFFEGEDATERLNDLADSLQAVEDHKGPFTLKALTEVKELGGVNLDGILSRWSEFENLPEETKKTVIQEYIVLNKVITEDAVSQRIKELVAKAPKNKQGWLNAYYNTQAGRDAVRRDLAGEGTMQKTKQDLLSADADPYEGEKDGAGKQNVFEFMLARLKNVRKASIDASKGIKELFKAVGDGKDAIKDSFDGIEQQFLKRGKNQQFIDYITGLDPETQKMFAKQNKEGRFVLTDEGKAMEEAFDEAIIGDFNLAQAKTIRNLNDQIIATNKLKSLGLSNSQIQEVLSDEAYTTAIATAKISDEELKINNALTQQAELRTKINDIITRGAAAEQRNQERKRIPEVKEFLKAQGLTDVEIDIAIKDENLSGVIAAMDNFLNKTSGATEEINRLKGALAAIAEDEAAGKAGSSLKQIMQEAYDAAMQMFEMQRKIDENTVIESTSGKTFTQLTKAKAESDAIIAEINSDIAKAENEITNIQDKIQSIQDDFDNKEITLDLVIDGKQVKGRTKYILEDLKEQIDDWEREIELGYTRPIQALQEESSVLSNDLTLMDQIAKDINEKYDQQAKALEEVSKINEEILRQQESQLDIASALTSGDIAAAARAVQESRAGSASAFGVTSADALQKSRENELANIRSANGLKREEIEKRIFDINQRIYQLETDPARKTMEDSILLAKDAIYNIEEARESLIRDEVRPLEEKILGIENDKLKSLKDQLVNEIAKNLTLDSQLTKLTNVLDKNTENAKVAGKTREEWDAMLLDAFVMEEYLNGDLTKAINAVQGITDKLAGSWENIKSKYDDIKTKIVEITIKYNDPGLPGVFGAKTGTATGTGTVTGTNADAAAKAAAQAFLDASKAAEDAAAILKESQEAVAATEEAAKARAAEEAAAARDKIAKGQIVNDYEWEIANDPNNGYTPFDAEAVLAAEKAAQDYAASIMAQIAAEAEAAARAAEEAANKKVGNRYSGAMGYENSGGMIKRKYMYSGGKIKHMYAGGMSLGADIVPAMLTPGEFVMSKYAVSTHGLDTMKALNNGDSVGDSVYNYSINVNVKSDANANEIASAVMNQIKKIDGQRIRGTRI